MLLTDVCIVLKFAIMIIFPFVQNSFTSLFPDCAIREKGRVQMGNIFRNYHRKIRVLGRGWAK